MKNLVINKKLKSKSSWKKRVVVSLLSLLLLAFGLVGAFGLWYSQSLRPLTKESRIVTVEIPKDSSLDDIATILDKNEVIRSSQAFRLYVRLNKFADSLKFGVYDLDSSLITSDIVDVLVNGQEVTELFTIPPGLRLDLVKQRFLKAGFPESEVDAALEPTQYENLPVLASKPKGDSLEGYLYPESFQRTSTTVAKTLVELSLQEMSKRLTKDRLEAFSKQNLNAHQAVTLASIIEKEVHLSEDRRVVAQIFLKRLRENIELGSDVTYEYAAAVFGGVAYPGLDNPYNTRLYPGLPPGPISNFDETALEAVANPTDTEYLFFLSGDDDKTYYGMNLEEHDKNIRDHCQQKCK